MSGSYVTSYRRLASLHGVCVCVFLLGVNNNVSRHCLVHREQICISNGDHYVLRMKT